MDIAKTAEKTPFTSAALIISTLMLIAVSAIASFRLAVSVSVLKEDLTAIMETTAGLERSVGYGGLIHDFKNAILRPEAPLHIGKVRSHASKAESYVAALEDIAVRLDADIDLSEVKAMVSAYRERIDKVEVMTRQKMSARDIDEQVRFNDDYALKAIGTASAALSDTVYENLSSLFRLLTATLIVIALSIVGLVFTLLWASRSRHQLVALNNSHALLQKTNSNLESANLSLQQFAGIAAHDLKAPIKHMSFFASELIEESPDQDEVKAIGEQIEQRAERMRRLIESLLQFAETQFVKPDTKAVNLASVVESAAQELAHAIKEAGAEISIAADVETTLDPDLMQRVFANLISNSIKYIDKYKTPEIRVVASTDHNGTRVSFSDNGIGIDQKYAERIFQPMERLHSQSKYGGVGIGLSLVRSIIDGHGGRIYLDASYDKGSQFIIELPH